MKIADELLIMHHSLSLKHVLKSDVHLHFCGIISFSGLVKLLFQSVPSTEQQRQQLHTLIR